MAIGNQVNVNVKGTPGWSVRKQPPQAELELVTVNAKVECNKGEKPATLMSLGAPVSVVGKKPVLTIEDKMLKEKDFFWCTKLNKPCKPEFADKWKGADKTVTVGLSAVPALHKGCELKCKKGGKVKITDSGQGSAIEPADLEKILSGLTEEEFLEFVKKYGLDYLNDAFQNGAFDFIEKGINGIDTSMPNIGDYLKGFQNGKLYWNGAGYSDAVWDSLMKKGFKGVTVGDFGVGKAKTSGLGILAFGLDYYSNRNDGESVGEAFSHSATTTAISGGLATAAGVLVYGSVAATPVGWAIGAGIVAGTAAKFAYDNNFLWMKDGAKNVGKAIDSGINSIKSVFGW